MKKKFKRFKKWFQSNKRNLGLGALSVFLALGVVALSRSAGKQQYIAGYFQGCVDTGRMVVESLGGAVNEDKLYEYCAKASKSKR